MIAALAALVAAVLLAVGYFADVTALGWVALAAAAVAVVLLFVPTPAPEPFVEPAETPAPEREPVPHLGKLDDREPGLDVREPELDVRQLGAVAVATDLVLVVPGRRRSHRPGCALLGDHQVEQLTEEEAQEEEFSACTRCVT